MSDSSEMPLELFREFEKQVLRILVMPRLGAEAVKSIEDEAAFVSYEHSGCGYFLTVRHHNVPKNRVVCDTPIVVGRVTNTPATAQYALRREFSRHGKTCCSTV